ncbi:lysophospholipid acyltransferase family protein [Pediococcus inopinatus]|uniref:1-acyl-sn-glycerol-3-phosphate acyltransferase n=1 Tax=Pediococcus inopinatus TaxID=114090 RepID=A0ABZ0Q4R9_9LACO|nr:lysophospholipid acyltransferase family protein [Pediococcus inopinatus]WPC20293.1 1-acyl-sn-glycerol-3-phosphate acyltransferase [Pediococcus inopinatus]WPC21998.1 1-acyl-sn-glycerol-3-phosphate acyltransferase [Pediococcus inopinatus]WPP09072.1 lysophospholipid acyltransferase family protein [Pediococcus inopinatus]
MRTTNLVPGKREPVIANIQKAVAKNQFNAKVEVSDAKLSSGQEQVILSNYLKHYNHFGYKFNHIFANELSSMAISLVSKQTKVVGIENMKNISGGGVVTSNHFNPMENLAVRKAMRQAGKGQIFMVSQLANLKMPGILGFIMTYSDTIPIDDSTDYMGHQFPEQLREILAQNRLILIYPEQEMWFNYRKPRPPKRGAYYYAAQFNVPIISCFVEIKDLDKAESDSFKEVSFVCHVLKPIYPDPSKSVRENSLMMMHLDYEQKCNAYEKAYGKPLTYEFESSDIAGWIPHK